MKCPKDGTEMAAVRERVERSGIRARVRVTLWRCPQCGRTKREVRGT